MAFPINPIDGQTAIEFGRTFVYKSSSSTWMPVSSPSTPTVRESIPAPVVVANAADLPMVGNTIGRTGYVSGTNRLYIWNGSGWFEIALVNTNPTITDSGLATYELNSDGTPTVITLVANDPEGVPLTWSHTVSSGSLEDTTVTNVDNVFTITPGEIVATFDLTFTASDGINIDTSTSAFTLSFGPDWTLTTQQAKIQSSDIYLGDRFGHSVAIDGDTAIVGAFLKLKEGGGNEAGAAYVFTRSGTTWTQQAKLLPDVLEDYDNFGSSVGISGDTVVIGSRGDRSPAGLPWSGSAYIFTRSGTTWTQQARIQPSEVEQSDYFGYSVAIDGDTVVVGAQLEDTGADGAGSAYIYTRSGTTWTQQAKIQASDKQASDEFGYSVAIDGNTVVVGAVYEDTGGSDAGAAYVFTRSGTTWTQQAKLLASDRQASDYFGWWVTVDGDTVVVGAPAEDTGGDAAGAAYIFTRSGTTWTQQAKIQSDAAADVWFGFSVSVEGDAMVVGAYRQDTGGANAGAAYIFTRDGTTWTQEVKIQASDAAASDLFGWSVAMSGNTVISGAYNENSSGNSSGAAYIFVAG
jgi:hypothetical protein